MDRTAEALRAPEEAGYQVDDLSIDVGRQRVRRGDSEIVLPQLSFDLLLALVRAAPNLLSLDQLMERVWPGLVVNPETVSQRVKLVRDALGDDSHAPRYIAGVRGRGYRIVAPVVPSTTPIAPHTAVPVEPEAPAPADSSATTPARRPRWAWVALAPLLLVVALAFLIPRFERGAVPAPEASVVTVQPPRTIAVLPLIDISPGGGNEYLGDGLAEELASRLGRVPGLRVAAGTSTFVYKGRDTDVRTIAQRLGVRHVLEGSVRRDGERLRVTAQLIDARSGYQVWTQTYDRTWRDLLGIQDELARAIVGALQIVLSGELLRRVEQGPTASLAAFDLYLAGLSKLRQPYTGTQHAEAEQAFQAALAADPRFARAHAGLCELYALGYERTRHAAMARRAEVACNAALALDASLVEVEAALGNLYLVSGRSARAVAAFERVTGLEPGDADAWIGLARAYEAQGRTAAAERTYARAIEAEPGYWAAHTALGNFLFHRGRAAAAVPHYRRVTQLAPASPSAFNNLGAALEMTGALDEAVPAFERSLALEPTRSAFSNAGTVYHFLGRFAAAAEMYRKAAELAGEDHRVWGNLGDALYQLEGGRPEAAEAYRRAAALAEQRLRTNPEDASTAAQLGYYHARLGEGARARHLAARALELGPDVVFVHYYAALVELEAGDTPRALAALRRAIELGYPVQLVRAAPELASLRGDGRFQRLIAASARPAPG